MLTTAGLVPSWERLLEVSRSRWYGRLPIDRLLEPAIAYAEAGFEVGASHAFWLDYRKEEIQHWPGFADAFQPWHKTPDVGALFRQPDLADLLRMLVSEELANSHTRASYCGAAMTAARAHARAYLAGQMNAGPNHAVIFCGSGATAGINRLVHLFGLHASLVTGRRVVVLIGPWEHHSNILPWRESGAEIIELPEGPGGPCPATLERTLQGLKGALVIGAFSAASNVTGAIADVPGITAILKRHSALSVWDYAGGGPYLPIDIDKHGIDAAAISPHKFPGGPGASGVLCVRRTACVAQTPTFPGGGTVSFASPWGHTFSNDITAREEGGTPNVIGDLRAAMAFAVKAAIGTLWMHDRHTRLVATALERLGNVPGVELLHPPTGPRLPVFSLSASGTIRID